jgi:hypothetical protein
LLNLTSPSLELKFLDGSSDVEKTLIVAPIFLQLSDDDRDSSSRAYSFYVGVVPQETTIIVKLLEADDFKYYAAIFAAIILSLILSTYCVF